MKSIVFASGLSECPTDLAAAIRARRPVGIAAQVRGRSVSQPVRKQLIDYANDGGKVFIDSGAFTAFKKGATLNWPAVFFSYRELIQSVEPEHRHHIHIVAPDIVGDYHGSRALQRQHLADLVPFFEGNVTVIVPVQKPPPADEMNLIDAVAESIAFDFEDWIEAPNFIMGLPYNACAWSPEDVAFYLRTITPQDHNMPRAIHLLGGGSTKTSALANAPHTTIHGDSLLSTVSRRKRGRTVTPLTPGQRIMATLAARNARVAATAWGPHE